MQNLKVLQSKKLIASRFNRAVLTYSQSAHLQQAAGYELIDILTRSNFKPKIILDIGSGLGYFSKQLQKIYPSAKIILLDIAEKMLSKINKHRICADFDSMPIKNNAVDMIFCNMALQWSMEFSHVLQECRRVLKNNGKIIFSMPIEQTLYELISCLRKINFSPNEFLTREKLIQDLNFNEYKNIMIYSEQKKFYYPNVISLIKHLKSLGVNSQKKLSLSGLCGKKIIRQLNMLYEPYRNPQGLLPVTYDLIYCIGEK